MFQDMNAVYRDGFPPMSRPCARRCGAASMAPEYLVEITMLAVKERRSASASTHVRTPTARRGKPNPVLSSAIGVGDRLYLSGMLGDGREQGDAAAQTRETLARLGRTLKAAGFEWSDVVDAVVYLPRLEDFAAMNTALPRAVRSGPLPARATVEAGLVAPDGLVEIMMTAVKGEKRYVK